MNLFPCVKNALRMKNPWTVVLVPESIGRERLKMMASLPTGSVCTGRTWQTPTGQKVTFAIPTNPIPEGEFDLVLCGWGHRLSAEETLHTKQWRSAAHAQVG